jgi:uncharacterized DUF497 family protein
MEYVYYAYTWVVEFEWDATKEARNRDDHRIDFNEGREVFDDPLATVHLDPDHSHGEHRLIIIGWSKRDRILVTVFVERGGGIRIISSRRATRREVRDYEEGV